jgi:nitrous oxidase accessory protein NosD
MRTSGGRPPGRPAFLAAVTLGALALASGAAAGSGGTATLYVSAAGSDSKPCTEVAPCRTIGHAVSIATAGGKILVGPGTYPEQVTIDEQLRLDGDGATIDATGQVNGIVVTGAGAAGSKVRGFTVENATGEGILVTSTSLVTVQGNTLSHDDLGAGTNATPECANQGNVPGDCGEALHLMGVADSHVVDNHVVGNVGGILITDETGPSHGNVIADNVVTDNLEDCGITLPSHNPLAVGDPTKAGVYDNVITDNVSRNNGGAGVGMFAPFPGAASYDNRVVDNEVVGNGEAGVAIHAHAPGENVSGNVIQDNDIAGNGIDPDAGSTGPNGISIFSAASPVSVTITDNEISREQFGVFVAGPVTAQGLSSNEFAHSVTVPVGHP